MVRLAWERDVLHYSLSLAAVQGGVFVAQLVVARLLGPGDFGYVRVVDTVLAILVIPAGAGMASAVVRYTATARNDAERGAVLSVSFWTVVGTSLVIGAIALLALPLAPLSPKAVTYLRWLVWTLAFTNGARVIINYFQGRKEIRRVAGYNVALAAAGAAAVIAGAAIWGLPGWAGGRFAGEVLLAMSLAWLVRRAITLRIDWHAARPILAFGAFTAFSAMLDRVATMADTLYLDGFLRDPVVVGQYGAAMLAVNVALLLPAAVTAVALPHLSERAADPARAWDLAARLLKRISLLGVGGALVMVVAGPWLTRVVLGPDYTLAGDLLQGLAAAFALNVVMSFLGTVLLALDRADLTVIQSVVGVAVNLAANALLIPRFGAWGAVWAAVATAAVRAAILAWFMALTLRRLGVNPRPR
jgi:O-antigen/teichoic acid export membrane protein